MNDTNTNTDLTALVALVKKFYDIAANRKAVTACYESLRDRIIDHMEANDVKAMDVNGNSIKLRVTETVNYDKALNWLKEHGHNECLKYRVDNDVINVKTYQRVKDHAFVKAVTALEFNNK